MEQTRRQGGRTQVKGTRSAAGRLPPDSWKRTGAARRGEGE